MIPWNLYAVVAGIGILMALATMWDAIRVYRYASNDGWKPSFAATFLLLNNVLIISALCMNLFIVEWTHSHWGHIIVAGHLILMALNAMIFQYLTPR